MKRNHLTLLLSLLAALSLIFAGAASSPAAAQANQPLTAVTLQIEPEKLTWQVNILYRQADLTITAPDESQITRTFQAGQAVELPFSEVKLSDGSYAYELRLLPVIDALTAAQMRLAANDPDLRSQLTASLEAAGKLPQDTLASGFFSVQSGVFAQPVAEGGNQIQDVVHADDVIITGSECIGYDCLTDGTESFGFDTLKMKENNLQIFFDDTSTTAGFAANDWRIITNDSSSGGANYFSIEDSTAARRVFTIAAGARANALYISSTGRVGLGTNTPVLDLHIVRSDTPAVRLEQDASGGWTPQIWDMAGNESNFFIRDVTGGSKLPFRIQPGAPTNSLTLKANGNVGIGTWSPNATLDIESSSGPTTVLVTNTLGAGSSLRVMGDMFADGNVGIGTTTPAEKLHVAGNIRADGYVIEYSDVNAKENFAAVDSASVLDKIAELPILSWNYKAEDDSVRHIGPMAQDFFAAFGLGADNRHIAALDTNGISLAAIQELIKINKAQQAQIDALEKENAKLEARIERLEKAILP